MIQQKSAVRIDRDKLQYLDDALRSSRSIVELSAEMDYRRVDDLLSAIANSLGLSTVNLDSIDVDNQLLEIFPAKLIHRYEVFPISEKRGELHLAVSNPFDFNAIDAVGAATGKTITPVVTDPDQVRGLIKTHFGVGADTINGLMSIHGNDSESIQDLAGQDLEDAEAAQQASVVRLVNEILTEAIESRTSDIHIEAQEKGIKIRYRIDGVLQRQPVPQEMNRFQNAIVSRLKIMAKLNIAEKRVPQDGRIKIRVKGREVDIRVSIIPMLHGEGIVMRILDKENLSFSLRGIGMSESVYKQFQKLIKLPHGIVLVTGPTGSGKTTTLYSALEEIKNEDTKIITTEDPIEYQLDGINQIQVHKKVGLTFATSLRSILRHDPDVVLVGEIRDLETAENATQASLTGHLVFSTLHTNDSAGAFMRLCDMGVDPFLVTSTIEGILAQRLVRKLCNECSQPVSLDELDIPEDFPVDKVQSEGLTLRKQVGCPACRNTGYSGRLGIYELLVSSDRIRALAGEKAPTNEIKKAAVEEGMTTLRMDGWEKVLNGVTTVEEVLRVSKTD